MSKNTIAKRKEKLSRPNKHLNYAQIISANNDTQKN